MSHFPVLVILPKDTTFEGAEAAATALLAPYDENTEVEPYAVDCLCINLAAMVDAKVRTTAEFGSVDALRASFVSPFPDTKPYKQTPKQREQSEAAWRAHIAPMIDAQQRYTAEHPMAGKPDPACTECHGTGTRMTTYNPKSRWDWWHVGGRWHGAATEAGRDFFPMSALKRDWSAFAIVTPDGAWHEKGTMGWWAVVTDEKPDWDAERFEIASAYPEHMALYVDCHI